MRNYKLISSVGRHNVVSIPARTEPDTGADLYLTHKRRLHPAWHSYTPSVQSPRLLDKYKRVMRSCGLTYLIVRIGEFWARVPLLVVQIFAVDSLPGTSFIDLNVKAIFSELRRTIFYYHSFVATVILRSLTRLKASLINELQNQSRKAQTTRNITIRPASKAKVRAHPPTGELCSVQSIPRLATKHLTSKANGIVDIFPHILFNVLLSNFNPCPVQLSRSTVTGHVFKASE